MDGFVFMSMITNCIGSDLYSEAAGYLGNRRALRKEVEMCPDRISLLEAQTDLMSRVSLHKGILWSVQLEGVVSRIYLFAVSHRSMASNISATQFFHPIVLQKFQTCSDLYTEVTTNSTDIWSEDDKKLLEKLAQMVANQKHKPHFLSESVRQISHRMTTLGLDGALEEIAPRCWIDIHPLESIQEQYDCYSEIDSALSQTDEPPSVGEMTLDFIDAIQAGNFEQICDLTREGLPEVQMLLQKRNPNMVAQMIQALERKERAFFAIGASHFVGTEGILALLSKDERVHISRIQLP